MASPTPPPKEPRPNPESLGRSALRNGFITPGQLSECLQLLEAARRQGRPVRLGQILVERGYLTPTQIQDLLAGQQKVLMRCSGCGRQFNVVRPEPGLSFRCPPCGGVLMSPRILGEVSADGSWFTEPGPPERVAEEVLEEETPRPATPPRQPRYRPYAPPPLPPAPRGSRLRTAGMVCGSAILLIVAVGFPLGLFDEPGPRTAGVRSPSAPGESETGTGPAAPLARRAPTEGEPSQARRAPGEGEGPKSRRTPGEGDARPASGAPEAKPPVPSAPDPFLAALESARKVIVAGDLPAARSAVAALERDPAARDPQHAAEMDRLRGGLRRRVRALFDRLAAEIDTLCREGKFDEAESLCDKAHELTDSETSRTLPSLVDRVRAGREKAALASLRPAVPPAEELAAWKSDGEARVRAAREQIAAARTEERDRIAQQKARLLEATKRDPIDIQWSDKLALKRCLVSDFSRDKVRLVSQSPPVEMEGPWEGLPNESVYEIRKTALDPKDARGWFDLGRFLALKRMGRQAVQAFDQAFATDASLRAVAPDMAKVLSPPTLFNATNYRVAGGFVHLLYDFGRAEEAQDFQGQGAEAEVKDGRLELRGRGFVACTIRDIPFTGKVSYALDPGPAVSSWVSFGMIQTSAGGNRRLYRVLYYPEEASWFFMEVGEDVETPRAIRWTGTNSRKPRFVLGLDGSEFTLSIDGEVVHRSRIPKIDEVMLFAGGVAVGEGVDPDSGRRVIAPMSNRPAAVACERIEVTGAVPPSWLSKVRSSEAAMFERELEDGLKVKPGETASHLPHPFREPAWSVYPPAWRDAYEKAHRAMDTFVRYEGAADYVTAANALAAALATAPRHPGVWYLAGQLALWSGEEEAASESCRRALDFDPRPRLTRPQDGDARRGPPIRDRESARRAARLRPGARRGGEGGAVRAEVRGGA
ncbi:MAG: hypothetical protein HYY93_14015 [Planctomycetes bacterium]|nr:hypothetical protein [Planctomycetota bacterium]